MPPKVTFIRPNITKEEREERLKNYARVVSDILGYEVTAFFENENTEEKEKE